MREDASSHREVVANRKLGDVPGFQWYRFECVGDDAIVFTGAIVVGTVTKGPRKGRPKYAKETRSVVVTDAEEHAEYRRFESETGKCGTCLGKGRVCCGWHHIEGTKYRDCSKCHGSGDLDAEQCKAWDRGREAVQKAEAR